ncbi:iron-sulfur cluster repair protein YtfE [Kordiimonas sp.]|uniref:iron-sulfur cluster repair protein YtfE n=1 Tax=Kordiimonas sp. TaxID=1970157 RepID=UPI003A8EF02E
MTLLDTSLAQLAQELPGATAIFNHYNLSFCCGGKHTLREAASKASLDCHALEAELLRLKPETEQDRDWTQAEDAEIIAYLLKRFHEVHRVQLVELKRLAHRVESVHGDREECPHGLTEHLHRMAMELEQHMQKEESILFPLLAGGQGMMAGGPIQVMLMEHEGHREEVARMDALTDNLTLPRGACNTWRALYSGLEAFKADLDAHIHLENDVLFARYQGGPNHG